MSFQIYRKEDYRQGLWRNGRGVSWDIASDHEHAEFGWRLAIARIDGDVPFSHYPEIDRVFTLLDGNGLDLAVAGRGMVEVHERFRPAAFPGDADTFCTLIDGTCRALNLFVRRGLYTAQVRTLAVAGPHRVGGGRSLIFALQGEASCGGHILHEGDTLLAAGPVEISAASPALLYVADIAAADGR